MNNAANTVSKPVYRFYLETDDGKTFEWRPLSRHEAVRLYNHTDKVLQTSEQKFRYGWEEIK